MLTTAPPPRNTGKARETAFTLAEVLITLGIIGVIAALTIPALINNYNKQLTLTRMKAFYSTMSRAFKLSEIENGCVENWDWPEDYNIPSTKDWYERYLSKYIQSVKSEETEKGYVVYYKNGSAVRINTAGGYVHFVFAKKASEIRTATAKNAAAYMFGISQSACPQFETYRCKFNEIEQLKYHGTYGCYNKESGSNAFCARLIQKNGWEFPDDYPWGY